MKVTSLQRHSSVVIKCSMKYEMFGLDLTIKPLLRFNIYLYYSTTSAFQTENL